MKILGRNIGIFTQSGTEWVPIGMSTSCSIQLSADAIEVAGMSARGRSFIPGRYSYTIQVDTLYGGGEMDEALMQALLYGDTIHFVIAGAYADNGELIRKYSTLQLEGDAILTNYTMTAPSAGYATANVSLQGSGNLYVANIDGLGAIDLGDSDDPQTGILDYGGADIETTRIIDLGKS